MKRILLLIAMLLPVVAFVPEAEAAKLSKKVLRKFYGKYTGVVSGVYGVYNNGAVNPQPTEYETTIRVNGRKRITAFSGTSRPYDLRFRAATGNRNRIRIRGTYSGDFTHPVTSNVEQATGVRRYTIRKRGSGRNARYIMKAYDELREGTLSYSRVKGTLEK